MGLYSQRSIYLHRIWYLVVIKNYTQEAIAWKFSLLAATNGERNAKAQVDVFLRIRR